MARRGQSLELAAHADLRAGLPEVLGAPHELGLVKPSPRSLLLGGHVDLHRLLDLGAHAGVDDFLAELDDDRHADADGGVVVEHLDDVDVTVEALDLLGDGCRRSGVGIRVRQGRRDGIRGIQPPGFLGGPHSALEGSLHLVVVLIGDLDVLEGAIGDGELQGVARLQLGDRVVRRDRQSCWSRGRRRGRGRPTGVAAGTRTVFVQGRLGASCNGHWQSHGTCGQNRTPGQSRRHSTSMFCVRNESHGPFRWEDERDISYSPGPATPQTSTGPKRERSLPADQPRTVLSRWAVMASRYPCMNITVRN